jgi:hypothetical protein
LTLLCVPDSARQGLKLLLDEKASSSFLTTIIERHRYLIKHACPETELDRRKHEVSVERLVEASGG